MFDILFLGVLAVTRSLGDSAMKEFVVGAPYTTETELGSADEFLIIACDGVRASLSPLGSTGVVTDYSLSPLFPFIPISSE
jgi:serine/threonine protein phosphatase PrpC